VSGIRTCYRSVIAAVLVTACLPFQGAVTLPTNSVCSIAGQNAAAAVDHHHDPVRDPTGAVGADANGGAGVVVAVLDTGIDATHPALAGKVVASINFSDSGDALDHKGHGTHVAGIIAGGAGPDGTTVGIAADCRLLNVKVASDDGMVTTESLVKGIRWAADHGADVINISLTVTGSEALAAAVDYAWQKGAVIVASAGNSYVPFVSYPAGYPDVIAVAATDDHGQLAWWSNTGPWVDLAVPGSRILSAVPGSGWERKSGTSMAAAYASGEAALMVPFVPDLDGDGRNNTEIVEALEEQRGVH